MTSQKRRASQELNRNSIEVLEPVQAPTTMTTISDAISRAWSWCRDWCTGWFGVPTYTTMSYTSSKIVADSHIQSSQERDDGATALKRQKLRPTNQSRSRSVVDEHRKAGRGKLDYTGCVTEDDFQQRINDYWAPPELGLLKASSKPEPRVEEPEPKAEEPVSDESKNSQGFLYRRYSDSFHSPSTGELILPPVRAPGPRLSFSLNPTTPKSVQRSQYSSRSKYRTPDNGITLEERLNNLFLTPEDEKEPALLNPSEFIAEKRSRLARERKVKEREAAIRAAKELRLTRRHPLKALVQPLSPAWESAVNDAQWTNSPHRVITTTIGGTELRLKDFQTLLGHHAWLNDEIINAYIEWIVDAANRAAAADPYGSGESAKQVPKFIAHNSFFYENLIKKGPASTQGLMRRKKAPGTSLMEVDSVFIPICKGSHWTVGVVRPIAKTIEYFDSMGGSPQHFVNLMRSWLKFQLGDAYIEEEWKTPRTACARQNNGYDCGVFVCTNAFCVALGLDTSCYRESDMTQQRRNIAAVLLNRGFTGDFEWAKGGLI